MTYLHGNHYVQKCTLQMDNDDRPISNVTSPQNEHLNLMVRIKFLNLFYIYISK